MNLDLNNIELAAGSVVDETGKVFYYNGGVYRAIYSEEYAEIYRLILSSSWFNDVIEAGLIETEVVDDLQLDGAKLILQHRKLPFFAHPVEFTSHMYWEAAYTFLKVNCALVNNGYMTKDSHPWNLMVDKGKFRFIDFGSIVKTELVPVYWL